MENKLESKTDELNKVKAELEETLKAMEDL